MNPLIQFKTTPLLLVTLALVCFGVLPRAQAVVPPPDGGYANFTTAEGTNALLHLTSGGANTGLGWSSLLNVTTGSFNTGVGAGTLALNAADSNTAVGTAALLLNTTGSANTAVGVDALLNNTGSDGENNTAIGAFALLSNTDGANNTANGESALRNNTIGNANTAAGDGALFSNTIAENNTATGFQALVLNTEGENNTANGTNALYHNTTGSGNVALGFRAGFNLTTGDNNIDIGNEGLAGDSDAIRVGNTQTKAFVAGISGATVPSGVTVIVDTDGHLGTIVSSRQFKERIKPMNKASEAILGLKPVTFRYKPNLDPDGIPQFGLVAEDVAKVNPDLVARDGNGKPYTVRYEAVNAMLLNEFLKEHEKVQEQQATIVDLKLRVARQEKQIAALASGLQRVSAQLEASKPAPQLVVNDQ
jgi:Chaperone of endosialidase